MAALTTQTLVNAGTAPNFGAAAVSDTVEVGNGRNTFVVYRNADAVNVKTVTISVPGNTSYGQPTPDPAIAVPASGQVWIPLRKEFADASGAGVGRATLTVSGTGGATDVTVAVVRVG